MRQSLSSWESREPALEDEWSWNKCFTSAALRWALCSANWKALWRAALQLVCSQKTQLEFPTVTLPSKRIHRRRRASALRSYCSTPRCLNDLPQRIHPSLGNSRLLLSTTLHRDGALRGLAFCSLCAAQMSASSIWHRALSRLLRILVMHLWKCSGVDVIS